MASINEAIFLIMADHFIEIYNNKADLYDVMVRAEDYQGNLLPAIQNITSLDQKTIVDLGAGTGRMTRLVAPLAAYTIATDFSLAMLQIAAETSELPNCDLVQADHHAFPFTEAFADVCIAGWTFGHTTAWAPNQWEEKIGLFLNSMMNLLKPGGMAIILETLGTGRTTPIPPSESLATYYDWLEKQHDFNATWIRTDYQFASVEEADQLTRFFFGEDFGDQVIREQWTVIPECTGIWWKTKS